ncbi:MAG: hypothetical protein JNL65_11430 [Saprospiraceae bacterium]|nr:hypothetical protein [Saprospiraceae bacterium]
MELLELHRPQQRDFYSDCKTSHDFHFVSLSEFETIEALTQSWKCCKCKSENYIQKWTCSYCKHERCGNCKQLEG